MTYIDLFVFIFLVLLIILLIIDTITSISNKKTFLFTHIIYLLFNPKNFLENQINTIKDYETYNHSEYNDYIKDDYNQNKYINNFNHIVTKFNFIIFIFLFIFIIIPFIIYMSRNTHNAVPISIFIIIILIIGPSISKFLLKIILFIIDTPKNYLYNTKKRKKNIITI
tara:strand:+ start:41 stop:544 length:504 start_codon:yes stop_codon:yes gene_type:complete